MTKKWLCLVLALMCLTPAALAAEPEYESTIAFIQVLEEEGDAYQFDGKTASGSEVVLVPSFDLPAPFDDVVFEVWFSQSGKLASIRVPRLTTANDRLAALETVNRLNYVYNYVRFLYDEETGDIILLGDLLGPGGDMAEEAYTLLSISHTIIKDSDCTEALWALAGYTPPTAASGNGANAKSAFGRAAEPPAVPVASGYLTYTPNGFEFCGTHTGMAAEAAAEQIAQTVGYQMQNNGNYYMCIGVEHFAGMPEDCYVPMTNVVPVDGGWWMESQLTHENAVLGSPDEAYAFANRVWATIEALGAKADKVTFEASGASANCASVADGLDRWLEASRAGQAEACTYVYADNLCFSLELFPYDGEAVPTCWIVLNRP